MNYNDFEEEMRYKKKKKKQRPKKADHKHEFEPCILNWYNTQYKFDRERGFVGAWDYAPGSRCRICGKLRHGFPTEVAGPDNTWGFLHFFRGEELLEKYPQFPVIRINDFWDLD